MYSSDARWQYCLLLCIAWCVCAKNRKYQMMKDIQKDKQIEHQILNSKHLVFIYISQFMYTYTFPPRVSYRWQEERIVCNLSASTSTDSSHLRNSARCCSTTQPAGYWTCEAFPCSQDLSHKQSLKSARDWLALGLIDCWKPSHKNDCFGSWLTESINYRAMPADLNIPPPEYISHFKASPRDKW